MIEKDDVIAFFNGCAPIWDAHMVCNDSVIDAILDNAGVNGLSRLLDVACGTGVLVPYYIRKGVKSVLGVDISPAMVEIAKAKFNSDSVSFLCADAETLSLDSDFDSIVIYNAFPHFSNPEALIGNLSRMLKKGGTLTVAHSMSREKVNSHHKGAMNVSNVLCSAEELAVLFAKHLKVTLVISDDLMFQVCGKR